MAHSHTIASKFAIWKEQGKRKLKTFLARMGVPIRESSVNYNVMKSEFRERFPELIEEYASEFQLDFENLVFASFSRVCYLTLYLF